MASHKLSQSNQYHINSEWVDVKRSYPRDAEERDSVSTRKGSKKGSGKDDRKDSKGGKGVKGKESSKGEGKETREGGKGASKDAKGAVPSPKTQTATATGNNNAITDSRLNELMEMGFSLNQSKRVLADCGWDLNRALDKLLEEGIEAHDGPQMGDAPELSKTVKKEDDKDYAKYDKRGGKDRPGEKKGWGRCSADKKKEAPRKSEKPASRSFKDGSSYSRDFAQDGAQAPTSSSNDKKGKSQGDRSTSRGWGAERGWEREPRGWEKANAGESSSNSYQRESNRDASRRESSRTGERGWAGKKDSTQSSSRYTASKESRYDAFSAHRSNSRDGRPSGFSSRAHREREEQGGKSSQSHSSSMKGGKDRNHDDDRAHGSPKDGEYSAQQQTSRTEANGQIGEDPHSNAKDNSASVDYSSQSQSDQVNTNSDLQRDEIAATGRVSTELSQKHSEETAGKMMEPMATNSTVASALETQSPERNDESAHKNSALNSTPAATAEAHSAASSANASATQTSESDQSLVGMQNLNMGSNQMMGQNGQGFGMNQMGQQAQQYDMQNQSNGYAGNNPYQSGNNQSGSAGMENGQHMSNMHSNQMQHSNQQMHNNMQHNNMQNNMYSNEQTGMYNQNMQQSNMHMQQNYSNNNQSYNQNYAGDRNTGFPQQRDFGQPGSRTSVGGGQTVTGTVTQQGWGAEGSTNSGAAMDGWNQIAADMETNPAKEQSNASNRSQNTGYSQNVNVNQTMNYQYQNNYQYGQTDMQYQGQNIMNQGMSGNGQASPNSQNYYSGNYNNTMNNGYQNSNGQSYQYYSEQSSPENAPITVVPFQPYDPDPSAVNGGQQFLRIGPELTPIEVVLYNSGNSGWSFGKDTATGNQGWFPTSCVSFDVVKSAYKFDTKPELSRSYIIFPADAVIVVEKRYECGWWLGAVVGDNGSVNQKGYFPGNYTVPLSNNVASNSGHSAVSAHVSGPSSAHGQNAHGQNADSGQQPSNGQQN